MRQNCRIPYKCLCRLYRVSLKSCVLGKNDQDALYSQNVFSMCITVTGSQTQTRYPVSSDTANGVRCDGVTSFRDGLPPTCSTLNFLRLDRSLPSDLSGMKSGFLAGHSSDPPLPTQFPSEPPTCHIIRNLWHTVHRAWLFVTPSLFLYRMVLTPHVSVSRKQSVRMKKSRAADASVGIAASICTDEAYQAACL